ncbi:MAG: hypothetical protein E7624_06280 [Ruminococcaceae bacterium]|nr:hypothetical protein [Oscillospiraceae bacterium]
MKIIKKENAKQLFLSAETRIVLPECAYTPYLAQQLEKLLARARGEGTLCRAITMALGIPAEIRSRFSDGAEGVQTLTLEEEDDYVENIDGPVAKPVEDPALPEEEYAISFGEEIRVWAQKPQGLLRALSTLMMQSDKGELCEQTVLDLPACSVRGYRVYLPGRRTMGYFLEMLDFLVYYKYNALILEIGGAMEYKRRPLINEKWVELCEEMSEYSGKTTDTQNGQQWPKDSFHTENGDGAYLTQEECRQLAAECARRGIEVIPECPTLSHTDYICRAYPALAERQNDPYPDTYCPSHPDTYAVVFDILDEVIEVFAPKRINIGHDEYYSSAICERCRGKDPADIYAQDVTRIYEYLRDKGVGTLMWSEKILKARSYRGNRVGGWYDERTYNGARFRIPDMFRCVDKLPKGITHLHWYWNFGEHLDDEFHAWEFDVLFGNFNILSCKNYRRRIQRGVKGGFVSNWSSCIPEYMQRNMQYYYLISTGHALWSDTYDSDQATLLKEKTLRDMYAKYSATVKHPIKVRHAAHHSVIPKHWGFWCGRYIEDAVYLLGHYELTYTDGTTARLPVKLGTNIACRTPSDREILEASYSTIAIPDESGYLFEHVYENPCPEKKIASVSYVPLPDKAQIKVEYTFPEL